MKHDHEQVSVQDRWTALLATRLVLAVAVMGSLAVSPDLAGPRGQAVLMTAIAYSGLAVVTEVIRRRTAARALHLVGVFLVIDGLFLARVVNATGGDSSPINALVHLHVVAITLVVSLRVGLEAASMHAALVVATASAPGAMVFGSTLWSVPSGAALRATSYLVVAIGAAAYASLDERSLRRARAHLAAQVELLTALEETQTVDAAALVLGHHVVAELGFDRAAVFVADDDQAQVAVLQRSGSDIDHVLASFPLPPHLAALTSLDAEPVLVRGLDFERHPVMAGLMPDAECLVIAPLLVDDSPRGVILAEWPKAAGPQVPISVISRLTEAARYGSLALRSSLLLAEVEARSRRDLVTGLSNRRAFDEAIENEISRSERADAATSIVLIDLDHFKEVNDSQGHQAGDRVLAEVGRALLEAGRPHDLVARIGGDEFAILLPDCGIEDAAGVAERARLAVKARVGDNGVTACVGVATSPEHGRRPTVLIRSADQALYQAKSSGRDRVVVAPMPSIPSLIVDLTGDAAPALSESKVG